MRTGRRAAAGIGPLMVIVLVGCAAPAGDGDPSSAGDGPPAVAVTTDDGELELEPTTYCWMEGGTGMCADGVEPTDPPSVGAPTHVDLLFAEDDWSFETTFRQVSEEDCPLTLTTTAEEVEDGVHRIDPVGPAGDWRVSVFGTGPQGDLFVTFVWTTSSAAESTIATQSDCQA